MSEQAQREDVKELLAEKHFRLMREVVAAECAIDDALMRAVGADPDDVGTWPCDDIVHDDYDGSFEFRSTRVGFEPTPEQWSAIWALGFERCWICYVDGTERYAGKGGTLGPPKKSLTCRDRDGLRAQRQAAARLTQETDALREALAKYGRHVPGCTEGTCHHCRHGVDAGSHANIHAMGMGACEHYVSMPCSCGWSGWAALSAKESR